MPLLNLVNMVKITQREYTVYDFGYKSVAGAMVQFKYLSFVLSGYHKCYTLDCVMNDSHTSL